MFSTGHKDAVLVKYKGTVIGIIACTKHAKEIIKLIEHEITS
jgi:hypothetical protein